MGSSIADDLKTGDQPTPMQIFVAGNPLLGWQKRESKAQEKRGFVGEHAQLQLIACGGMHSAAVEKDGSCWLWGHGEYGKMLRQNWKTFEAQLAFSSGSHLQNEDQSDVCGFGHGTLLDDFHQPGAFQLGS